MSDKKPILTPDELKNPHKLATTQIDALIEEFTPVRGFDPALAADLVRYAVDGTHDAALQKIGKHKKATGAVGLSYCEWEDRNWEEQQHRQQLRTRTIRSQPQLAPEVLLRLGRIYEAFHHQYRSTNANFPNWLYDLLCEYQQAAYQVINEIVPWPLEELERLLECAELSPALVAEHVVKSGLGSHPLWINGAFSGWAEYLDRHRGLIADELKGSKESARAITYSHRLANIDWNPAPFVELLAADGVSSLKSLREAAFPFLQGLPTARPLIEKSLAEGNTSTRHEAAQLLWRLYGQDAAQVLRAHRATEKSERINQALDALLAIDDARNEPAEVSPALSLPPLDVETGVVPLPDSVKQGLHELFAQDHQKNLKEHERELARYNSPDRPQYMRKPPDAPVGRTETEIEELIAFVEGRPSEKDEALGFFGATSLGDWFAPPDVKLIHAVRLAFQFGYARVHGNELWWSDTRLLDQYRSLCTSPFGLRELDAAFATLPSGRPGQLLIQYLQGNNRWNSFCDWEPDAIWPAFAEHQELLRKSLDPPPRFDYMAGYRRGSAFKVLSYFPQLPAEFIPILWQQAVAAGKTDRPAAREALKTVPDKTSKVAVLLSDKKSEVRAGAAEWLGQIGDSAAIEPLKETYRKESQELVKGMILGALDALKADVSEFLDRKKLLKEAEKGLQKLPKGLDWFPLDSLPKVHWEDTGKQVDPQIVKWWVVQSVQQKLPSAGPLLRRYIAQCRRADAEALAEFVLRSWISHDTQTVSHESAAERATRDADQQWKWYTSNQTSKDYYDKLYGGNKENLYKQLLLSYQQEFTGSAIGEKGMLAVASAAGNSACVKLAEQYLKKHFGKRLAQCKCLIDLLAAIQSPSALQVLLGIANRFRTKALREQANEQVQAIADREGWTIDQLADRTIPEAGFERPVDEQGEPVGHEAILTLDFGPRQFTVKLSDDLEPVIVNAEGKTVKSLPAAGKSDDEELAKAAKKQFSESKKGVKEVVARQSERLYEALCTQRSWPFGDWKRYLADHPIVGRLCTRLVWAVFETTADSQATPKLLGSFRPLEDGSLTNTEDESVEFPEVATVFLAHTGNLPPALSSAWSQHLSDYDVEPLFVQFGRDAYVLPADKKNETEITDFVGHLLTTFKMRGRATKLGYVRGESEDAGWFYSYRKPFPSLGLHAVIHFTGNFLPEEDRLCALKELCFVRVQPEKESRAAYAPPLPLGKLPPVLLSECYQDLKQLAQEGPGFDPKWESKCEY